MAKIQIEVLEVVASMPWLGSDGIEGVLVTDAEGNHLLLQGLRHVEVKPARKSKPPNGKAPAPERRKRSSTRPTVCPDCGWKPRSYTADKKQAVATHRRRMHG